MRYRRLGRTNLQVSEIGFGCEWIEKLSPAEIRAMIDLATEAGINVMDCWMSDPRVRTNLGDAIRDNRAHWVVQGHIGSTWKDGQYVRTREVDAVRPAFEDMLARFHTDYIDLGMIHYVDSPSDFEALMGGPFIEYVRELRASGTIRHVGMSTHNPVTGLMAIQSGEVDMLMFSVNPAYDMKPASEDIDTLFGEYGDEIKGMDEQRIELYREAERADVGITVMKCFAGGRLLDPARSPFGVALTPAQCIHYALTRPAVASVLLGYANMDDLEQDLAYEDAGKEELDYASVLASAPQHPISGLCTYCGHCAPCPMGISVADVNKYFDLAEVQVAQGGEVPALVRDHYLALHRRADSCIGCGLCETRCPFGVPVRQRMRETAALFS